MFCSGTSVPPLGHFGPQPSDPRPGKVGSEPKPPTYILRRHLSFCFLVRRFRTRVLPSSLTFLYNFSSACMRDVLRSSDKLRLTAQLQIPQGEQETCLLQIKPEGCQATKYTDTIHTLPDMKKIITFSWESQKNITQNYGSVYHPNIIRILMSPWNISVALVQTVKILRISQKAGNFLSERLLPPQELIFHGISTSVISCQKHVTK